MLPIVLALRKLMADKVVMGFILEGVNALTRIAAGENRRTVAEEFARQATIKAELLAFDETMKKIPKVPR